jgi:DNA-binding winged helix-turn-helix (wHTH) protein/TolB-like protein
MLSKLTNSEFSLLIVGDYLFEPHAGVLSGPSGAHHICSRLATLLCYLVEHSNEVIERDELISELWQDDPHASNALTQCIGRLRHYFDDTAKTAKYIETVPNAGYRLVAPVYGSAKKPASIRAVPRDAVSGNNLARLFLEFRERKVCRSMLIYTIVIWLIFQVSEIVVPALGLPPWVNSLVVLLGILGFPVAAVLSWIFDLTPDGVVRGRGQRQPPRTDTPRKLSDLVIDTMLLAAAVCISGMLVISSLDYASVSQAQTGITNSIHDTAVSDNHTIAVRNFSIKGSDHLVNDISAEVTAEILSILIQRGELDVLAGGALDGINNSQISHSHGADSVLEGSVGRSGSDIQISLHLLDAHTKEYVWNRVIKQPVHLRTALAEEVSKAVLNALTVLKNRQHKGYAQTHKRASSTRFMVAAAPGASG